MRTGKCMEKVKITIGDPNNAMIDDMENSIVFRVDGDLAGIASGSRYTRNILPINTYTDTVCATTTATNTACTHASTQAQTQAQTQDN